MCRKLSINQMYQLKILMSAHSLFYSVSFHSSHNYSTQSSVFNLPSPLFTSNDGQRCPSYQLSFLWKNYLLILNKFLSNSCKFKITLKNHPLSGWLIVWLWNQWLMSVGCRLPWSQHAIGQATVHFGSIIINRCNFLFSNVCHCFVIVITVSFVIFNCKWNLMKIYEQTTNMHYVCCSLTL